MKLGICAVPRRVLQNSVDICRTTTQTSQISRKIPGKRSSSGAADRSSDEDSRKIFIEDLDSDEEIEEDESEENAEGIKESKLNLMETF